MYSKKPIRFAHYKSGTDFLQTTNYFDGYVPEGFTGGMRKRIFETNSGLRKFSLFKYKSKNSLAIGCHSLKVAKFTLNVTSCVLHFKYFYDFISKVFREEKKKVILE